MQCPACNHIPLAGNQPDPAVCPKCGVAYAESIRKNVAARQQAPTVAQPVMAPHVLKVAQEHRGAQPVVIVDVKMSFNSMVWFMVKWVLASIPAFLILLLLLVVLVAVAGVGKYIGV